MFKRKKRSEFDALVKEACQVETELRELQGKRKLSAKGFLREALENADTTEAKLDDLDKAIVTRAGMEATKAFMRQAIKAMAEKNWTRPPKDAGRITYLGSEAAQAELGAVGANVFEALALAVREAVRLHPEAFGEVDDWTQYEDRQAHLQEKRAELFARIPVECRGDDLQAEDAGNGLARVYFACAAGAVTLHPARNAGERLVNWLLSHPNEAREVA